MDEVLLGKAATIERCLKRIGEEYRGYEDELFVNFMCQGAIILNLLRACEASIDLAMYMVRLHHLGLPQSSRDDFRLLQDAGFISTDLARPMQRMVGFRNVAVHDYQALSLPILKTILEERLGDFLEFTSAFWYRDNPEG
ncbi:DUF86 domain-containing protein [Meiothermus sp. CFH 77666]|uniref:type VII toxin-antitoxin system HepT family RNase toxin n=1 Tax=Meiothermus sp. CFH 77666 TaxID=2817942 RepID=UPI001AA0881E|nr:DUF86 domain-containing protein [Meiothermus sp. CFH 77666]MBO1437618.1 DUF86 domain-containing protein [Meiothermus sp. CFH 77666]